MQQYRVENLDNQGAKINYSKKIKDVEPIEVEGRVLTRETLKDFIEEPCLDACRLLYDMNIQTHMSSANKKDVGRYAYIDIVFDTLSTQNQQAILREVGKKEDEENRIELYISNQGYKKIRMVKVKIMISEETTVGDIREGFMRFLLSLLKMQDVLYGRWSYDKIVEHIKECYGPDIEIDEELVKDTGFYYCAEDDVYFQSEELLNKHLEYKRREIHPEK